MLTAPQRLAKYVVAQNLALFGSREPAHYFQFLSDLTSTHVMSSLNYTVPSLEEMDDNVHKKLGFRACIFQLRSGHLQLLGKNVFTFAPTGAGKTLTFWIPLLFNDNGIQILVTPLNLLGDKNVREIAELFGISSVNVTAQTATDELFKVKYCEILIYPHLH